MSTSANPATQDAPASQSSSSQWTAALPARHSLERKLPMLMGALLLFVIVALTAAAYVEVRSSAMRISSERLVSLTHQFRDLFQQSAGQLRSQASQTAHNPDVGAFLKSPTLDAAHRSRALEALLYKGANPEQVVATELRDSAGMLLLNQSRSGWTQPSSSQLSSGDLPGGADSVAIGRFRLVNDTVVYKVAARVPGTRAFVVQWRKLSTNPKAREQITKLVGSDASLFLGNADGSRWTDLDRPITMPAGFGDGSQPLATYTRGGHQYLVSGARIPTTPWSVAIDFPFGAIMAPVDNFLRRIALIAGVALALALLAAWLLSRRITAPLSELTTAADTIAAGDISHADPVHVTRSDEIGRLGRAFNAMAKEIAQSREGLERKVAERTRELSTALEQLRETQETLVRGEKLAMLGQLASGVGHELRNPLGVMTNAIYYLKMVLSESPKNVAEYLDILQQQITLSEKIVSDLLDFARQKPPRRKAASLREITTLQLGRLGSTNGTRVTTRFPEALPPVLVDDVQIGQIVLNLLTNAQQAMEGSGMIFIRAKVDGEHVVYEVADTGPGIPPENLEKVFEPLFTTKARGIGLGLAVSRTLARANNGDLTVTSEVGKGATFRLTLPIAKDAAA